MELTLGLNQNIANTAHDMKSPACALSLAVGSLISAFHGKTRIEREGCKFAMETLTGMMHTLSSLNTIINRSVVRDRTRLILQFSFYFFFMYFCSPISYFFPICCIFVVLKGCGQQNYRQLIGAKHGFN